MIFKKLSNKIRFWLVYQDDTRFGSPVTNRADQTVRDLCSNIIQHRQVYKLPNVIARSRELLAETIIPGGLAELYTQPGQLLEDWLYPVANQVKPIAIDLERNVGELVARIHLPPELFTDLASYLGDWEVGSAPPTHPIAAELWSALNTLDAFDEVDPSPVTQEKSATFVGHSTVKISDGKTSILFDPFLLPKSDAYPPDYQPLSLQEIGRPDAVFITHSHPDHFDLGTLLRLGADTPIFVPAVERESVLAIDMAWRLRQLGFRQVRSLNWFEETIIGSIRVIALPFYGEQPTVSEVFHPEVRNQGNTYLVEVANQRIALTADSGTDYLGDVKQLAMTALERYGPIDTLFGGYRGFGLYPIQYIFSSVSRYLPFVPQKSWQVRQQTMCDVDDLIDLAEIWNAKQIVPYSDGGAPWYWMRGLGPTLDGSETHIMAVDPTPEYVCEVAARRTGTRQDGLIASPVSISLLRPSDSLVFNERSPLVHQGKE